MGKIQRLTVMIIGMLLVLLITGCASNNAAAEEVLEEEVTEEEQTEDEEAEDTEAGTAEAEVEEDDIYREDLIVGSLETKRFAQYFVLRDEEYYSLDEQFVPRKRYGIVGEEIDNGSGEIRLFSTLYDFPNGEVGFYTYGGVYPLQIRKDDKFVSLYPREIPNLCLYKVKPYGSDSAIPMGYNYETKELFLSMIGGYKSYYPGVTDVQVVDDETGEVIEDWYDVERNKFVTVSWFERGEYQTMGEAANSYAYTFEAGDYNYGNLKTRYVADYSISGSEIENGFAEYDLSEVSPGFYRVVSGEDGSLRGIIEVR